MMDWPLGWQPDCDFMERFLLGLLAFICKPDCFSDFYGRENSEIGFSQAQPQKR